jgi:hypothetical protein
MLGQEHLSSLRRQCLLGQALTNNDVEESDRGLVWLLLPTPDLFLSSSVIPRTMYVCTPCVYMNERQSRKHKNSVHINPEKSVNQKEWNAHVKIQNSKYLTDIGICRAILKASPADLCLRGQMMLALEFSTRPLMNHLQRWLWSWWSHFWPPGCCTLILLQGQLRV